MKKYDRVSFIGLIFFAFMPVLVLISRLLYDSNSFVDNIISYQFVYLLLFPVLLVLLFFNSVHVYREHYCFEKCISITLFIFISLIISGLFIRGIGEYDFFGHYYQRESVFTYLFYVFVILFSASILYCNEGLFNWFIRIFIISGFIVVCFYLISYLGFIDNFNYDVSAFIFHNSNHFGYFLCMICVCSFLIYVLYNDIICYVLFILCGFSIILNDTLGAFLSVLFVCVFFSVFYFIFTRNKSVLIRCIIAYFAFDVLTVICSKYIDTSLYSLFKLGNELSSVADSGIDDNLSVGSGRLGLWVIALKNISLKPFFGYGIEGMLEYNHLGTPHCEFLQYSANFGLPVGICYLLLPIFVFYYFVKNKLYLENMRVVCLFVSMAYFVSGCVGCSFYYTSVYYWIFLGFSIEIKKPKSI